MADVERPGGEAREQLEHLLEAHLASAADVVDAARDVGRDRRGAGRRDDVVDEGEVAPLAAVAEDRDRLARITAARQNRCSAMSGRWRGP